MFELETIKNLSAIYTSRTYEYSDKEAAAPYMTEATLTRNRNATAAARRAMLAARAKHG